MAAVISSFYTYFLFQTAARDVLPYLFLSDVLTLVFIPFMC